MRITRHLMTMSLINVQLLCFLLICSGELACLAPERLVRKSRGDFIFGVRSRNEANGELTNKNEHNGGGKGSRTCFNTYINHIGKRESAWNKKSWFSMPGSLFLCLPSLQPPHVNRMSHTPTQCLCIACVDRLYAAQFLKI